MEAISVAPSDQSAGDTVPVSVVHVTTIPNQSIISGHTSMNQTPTVHTIQTIQVQVNDSEGLATLGEDEESRRRREHLARRPSYRKILSDLSTEPNAVTKIEEESNSDHNSQDSGDGTDATFVPATIQIASDQTAGLQTLTMTNVNTSSVSSSNPAPTVLQYAQAADGGGQFLIPVSTLSAGNIQYQLTPASSLGGSVVMATAGAAGGTGSGVTEEASRKRELRLLKNREAARECRRKKKDYIKCLENRVALLENQNKTLIEELKSLKELYCQKDVQ